MHATSIRREEVDFKFKPVDFSISIEGPSVSCWFRVEERGNLPSQFPISTQNSINFLFIFSLPLQRKLKIQSIAMEILSQKWFHELDMEDFNLFHQDHMNSMEGGFNTREITAEIKEDKYGESLSSTRNCSYQTLHNITTKRCSSSEISQTSFEKPAKMAKINDWNSCIGHQVPPKPSSSFSSQFLSFIDSDFQRVSSNTPLKGTKRNSSTTRASNPNDHILAERKRREKLSQRFIALSAIVPGLKKMDKASVLGDSIKYIKQLHDRVQLLEEQTKKKTVESVVFIKKSQLYIDDDSSSCDENFDGGSGEALLPEIEARVSEKSVLLRIHCEKHKGFVQKIMGEIEKLHLSILHSSVLPFGSATLDITIVAEMEDEFNMTAKDLVRNIRIALIKFT